MPVRVSGNSNRRPSFASTLSMCMRTAYRRNVATHAIGSRQFSAARAPGGMCPGRRWRTGAATNTSAGAELVLVRAPRPVTTATPTTRRSPPPAPPPPRFAALRGGARPATTASMTRSVIHHAASSLATSSWATSASECSNRVRRHRRRDRRPARLANAIAARPGRWAQMGADLPYRPAPLRGRSPTGVAVERGDERTHPHRGATSASNTRHSFFRSRLDPQPMVRLRGKVHAGEPRPGRAPSGVTAQALSRPDSGRPSPVTVAADQPPLLAEIAAIAAIAATSAWVPSRLPPPRSATRCGSTSATTSSEITRSRSRRQCRPSTRSASAAVGDQPRGPAGGASAGIFRLH
jgi:hypothetical protein